jgi:hypothetical protein
MKALKSREGFVHISNDLRVCLDLVLNPLDGYFLRGFNYTVQKDLKKTLQTIGLQGVKLFSEILASKGISAPRPEYRW